MVVYASVEDFLYILVGIAWVAFSYYNAQKKKRAKESKNPSEKRKPSFLETLIDEAGFKTEEETPVYADPYLENDSVIEENNGNSFQDESEENYSQEVFSYDDYYEESNYQARSDVKDKKQSLKNDVVTTTISDKNKSKNKVRKVDLRKAVIYSEILEKKYF